MDDPIRRTETQLLNDLGALFAAARKTSAFSLKAISDITSISPSHILRMESGEQDFTVTKFARLCDAVGIPAGLALEATLLRTREFFQKGSVVHAEAPQLAVKLFGGVLNQASVSNKPTPIINYSDIIEWLLVTTSRAVVALLLSANPELLARQLHGPTAAIRQKIISFAARIEPLATVGERLGIIQSLKARPYFKLTSLGILDDKIVFDCIVSNDYLAMREPGLNVGKYLFAEPDATEPYRANPKNEAPPSEENDLTDSLTQSSIPDVKPLWPVLKRRLQSATAATGKKSELARFLKMDLTRVSQWLTDSKSAREPGAEYALQMLHWVEQQERQKQNALAVR